LNKLSFTAKAHFAIPTDQNICSHEHIADLTINVVIIRKVISNHISKVFKFMYELQLYTAERKQGKDESIIILLCFGLNIIQTVVAELQDRLISRRQQRKLISEWRDSQLHMEQSEQCRQHMPLYYAVTALTLSSSQTDQPNVYWNSAIRNYSVLIKWQSVKFVLFGLDM
jgi:hypothetical protein